MGNNSGKFVEEEEVIVCGRLPYSGEMLLKPLLEMYREWLEENKGFMMPVGSKYRKIFEKVDNSSLGLEEILEKLGYRLHREYQNIEHVDSDSCVEEVNMVKEMYLTLAGYYEN